MDYFPNKLKILHNLTEFLKQSFVSLKYVNYQDLGSQQTLYFNRNSEFEDGFEAKKPCRGPLRFTQHLHLPMLCCKTFVAFHEVWHDPH